MLCPVHESVCITMGDLCFQVTSLCVQVGSDRGPCSVCLHICVKRALFAVILGGFRQSQGVPPALTTAHSQALVTPGHTSPLRTNLTPHKTAFQFNL